MAKEKPYKVEQAVLEIDSEALETATEKALKEAVEKLKEKFQQKRKDRLTKQKNFVIAYYNVRELTTSLMEKVKEGSLNPDLAIKELKDFVASPKLLTETETQ